MDRAAILAALQPDYAVASHTLRGVFLRPSAATLVATLAASDEGFAAALDDGRLFSDEDYLRAILGEIRPTYVRLIAGCTAHVADRRQIDRIGNADFLRLSVECFSVSMPLAVQTLFKTRPGSSSSTFAVEDDIEDVAAEILKTACRLLAAGHTDAYAMSWTRLRFAEAVEAERDRDRLGDLAVGAKAGQADQKHWREFMRSLGRGS